MNKDKLTEKDSYDKDSEIVWDELRLLLNRFKNDELDEQAVVISMLMHAIMVTYEMSISNEHASKLIDKIKKTVDPEVRH